MNERLDIGLSVVTLARNRRIHLRHLIEGLCRSTHAPDELIIVDMGGTAIELPVASFPIEIIVLETGDLPLARARNIGALAARHGMVVFVDVDCIPMTGLLGAMRSVLETHDSLVCAEIRYLNETQIHDNWTEEFLRQNSVAHPDRTFPATGMRVESNPGLFWSLAFAIRADRFKSLGGFDERFIGYGAEDTDFGFRARQADVELLFLGGTGAFHQHHEIYDPPLQHFNDIIKNAKRFYKTWGVWPMRGWLDAFERLGLILYTEQDIALLRQPELCELAMAKRHRIGCG